VFIYNMFVIDYDTDEFYMSTTVINYFYFDIPFDFIITASIV